MNSTILDTCRHALRLSVLTAAIALAGMSTNALADDVCLHADGTVGTSAATGGGALACGYRNDAAGLFSSVFGYDNTANGEASNACGYFKRAMGHLSSAVGFYNRAHGLGGTAHLRSGFGGSVDSFEPPGTRSCA